MPQPEFSKKHLAKKSENISEWYHDVVVRGGLADYSVVKGCMIIKPNGYAVWENIQKTLDGWFKADGVKNVYFPLFIPMSLLQKEKDHVAGFSPELAVVEYAGGEKLAEPLAIRPTSETIMYQTFADWVQSHRDLPMKTNQWCNVVRWEKRTYPFLRTSEFLWQEGHTVHENDEDAEAMTLRALGWYQKLYEEYAAMAVYVGIKSDSEKFAGAKATYAVEGVMPDGKALQAATSHNLGDNFAKVFGIDYLDENSEKQVAHQTSWGFSTRSIGGLILSHGDDAGLVLPPRLAFAQVVVLAVGKKDDPAAGTAVEGARSIADQLRQAGVSVEIDVNLKSSLGFRINEWELQGVPLRLEVGARELAEQQVKFSRRDNFEKGSIAMAGLAGEVKNLLDKIQNDMYAKSLVLRDSLTVDTDSYEEFKKILTEKKSFVRVPWCEDRACEAAVKIETKATPRVLELSRIEENIDGKCFHCGQPARRRWLFAHSY